MSVHERQNFYFSVYFIGIYTCITTLAEPAVGLALTDFHASATVGTVPEAFCFLAVHLCMRA